MNPGMNTLHPYPFEKLAALTADVDLPSLSRIPLTIGEPKHQPPAHVLEALVASIEEMAKYPTIVGTAELRQQIASWIAMRFKTRAVDPVSEVLPVNGTREGLFAIAQAPATRPCIRGSCRLDRGNGEISNHRWHRGIEAANRKLDCHAV